MGFREKSTWKKCLYIVIFYPTLILGLIGLYVYSYSFLSFVGNFIILCFAMLFIKGCIESYND